MTIAPDPLALFFQACAAHADKPAVVEQDRLVVYAEIEALARRLAGEICATYEQVAAEDGAPAPYGGAPRVAIAAPAGALAYGAMFASLAAGGFYCPLKVDGPDEKLADILAQFDPTVVICAEDARDRIATLAQPGTRFVTQGELSAAPLEELAPAHDLAYVMFTSGSTGKPKGVMIPRAALANYLAWARAALRFGPGDRVSQHPAISFDISITDIYGALTSGACLCPMTSDFDRLMPAKFIQKRGITVWNSTPSVVNLMLQAGQVDAAHLKTVRAFNFCGEPMTPQQARALLDARPDALIQNTYGPTEATVSCTELVICNEEFDAIAGSSMALGAAIPNMNIHLVDGEIVISGVQLARGYWRDEAKTAQAFAPMEIDGRRESAYRTGDIAEQTGDNLFFKARKDFQVKINGHRLELGEVCAAIREAGFVDCVAAVVDGELHAFVEGPQPGLAEMAALQAALRRTLDAHAVPRRYHFVLRLPRNQNDKVDVAQAVEALRKTA